MIRQMKKDGQEEEQIIKIWKNESQKILNFIRDEKYWSESEKALKREIRNVNNGVFVWDEDGQIIGFIIIGKAFDCDNYIFELFVDTSYKKKRIGTTLMNFVLAKRLIKNIKATFMCDVHIINYDAVRFYIHMGFVIEHINGSNAKTWREERLFKYRMIWPKKLAPANPR